MDSRFELLQDRGRLVDRVFVPEYVNLSVARGNLGWNQTANLFEMLVLGA